MRRILANYESSMGDRYYVCKAAFCAPRSLRPIDTYEERPFLDFCANNSGAAPPPSGAAKTAGIRAAQRGGRDAACLDQGEIRAQEIPVAGIEESGSGDLMGLPDLQRFAVDPFGVE